MSKNLILDYVADSPHNTNRAILSQVVDQYVDEVVKAMGPTGTSTNADWNQNDENAPDYIKNRLCYEQVVDTVLVQDVVPDLAAGGIYFGVSTTPIEVGDICIVTIDGTKYITKPAYLEEPYITCRIPELNTFFVSCSIGPVHDGKYELIFGEVCTPVTIIHRKIIISQIDDKFIPSTISRESDVRQSIDQVNKYIDHVDRKASTQPDFSQCDESSVDYIKNKTHWDYYKEQDIVPLTEITWTATGYVELPIPIRIDKFEGTKILCLELNGVVYEEVCTCGTYTNNGYSFVKLLGEDGNDSTFGDKLTSGINSTTYTSKTEVIIKPTDPNPSTYRFYEITVRETKQLDEKYIPDSIARQSDLLSVAAKASARSDWDYIDTTSYKFIENRTHYKIYENIEVSKGYEGGRGDNSVVMEKVSDITPTLTELEQSTVSYDNNKVEVVYTLVYGGGGLLGYYIKLSSTLEIIGAVVYRCDPVHWDYFTETGIYLNCLHGSVWNSVEYDYMPVVQSLYKMLIPQVSGYKTIDPNYLPVIPQEKIPDTIARAPKATLNYVADAPTAEQFNALLDILKEAGILAT